MDKYERKLDINKQTKKELKNRLEDVLTYLGYVSYDESLKNLENDAIILQAQIEKFYKKIR